MRLLADMHITGTAIVHADCLFEVVHLKHFLNQKSVNLRFIKSQNFRYNLFVLLFSFVFFKGLDSVNCESIRLKLSFVTEKVYWQLLEL